MKRFALAGVICLALSAALLLAGCSSDDNGGPQPPATQTGKQLVRSNRVTKSRTVRHVKLTVSVPRKTAVGQAVDLSIALANEGTETVVFGRINSYKDCRIRVIDSKGQVCPFTPFGEQKMGGTPGEYRKYISTPLAPGESHTWEIDLAKCFQLKPGKYMVSASIEVHPRRHPSPDEFTIGVENLEFEMEAAAQPIIESRDSPSTNTKSNLNSRVSMPEADNEQRLFTIEEIVSPIPAKTREMPSIIADYADNSGDLRLEFECFYYESRKIQKGNITHHLREVVNIPIEKMPKSTVDFTRHLIQERFLSKPETWSDGFFGDSEHIKAKLRFVPVKNYYGEMFPELWDYALSIHSYHPQYGVGKAVWRERFLVSKNGHILHGGKRNSWDYSYVKRSKNGIFIDIMHSYFYPQDISAAVTGIVTECFYEFGAKELVTLKESSERVEVLHYLNNYFDGRFCNGKE